MTVTWPSELPDPVYSTRGRAVKHQVRTEKEGGYVQSRARHTRMRKTYDLVIHMRNQDQLDTFKSFFQDNQGGMFRFPFFGDETADYRFAEDEFDWQYDSYSRITVTVAIEEV